MSSSQNPSQTTSKAAQFVVYGESEDFPGPQHLGIHGGFLPAQGGHGRLSEERCRELVRRFSSRAEAQAFVDKNNAREKRTFTEAFRRMWLLPPYDGNNLSHSAAVWVDRLPRLKCKKKPCHQW